MIVGGNLDVEGAKHRKVTTKAHGERKMNAIETAEAFFCDVGSGTIGIEGYITIFNDPIFEEIVERNTEYQVFIQKTNEKKVDYVEKEKDFFRVYGENGATFDWIIYKKQLGYGASRMEEGRKARNPVKFNTDIFANDEAAVSLVEQAIYQHESEVKLL